MHYAIRIRSSYAKLAVVAGDWALRSDKVLIYEHPVPGNIHCHVLLTNVQVDTETLKNDMRKHGLVFARAEWSFKNTFKNPDKSVVAMTDENYPKYITYMSKGQYDPSYNKGFIPDEVADCKSAWVVYKHKSREHLLLNAFTLEIYDNQKKLGVTYTPKDVKKHALRFMSKLMNGVINLGARRDMKMLIDSFGYSEFDNYDIKLPFE